MIFKKFKKNNFTAYRIYDENGDKFDSEGRKFKGWSSKYDEWLTVTNPRIAKFLFFLKKIIFNFFIYKEIQKF